MTAWVKSEESTDPNVMYQQENAAALTPASATDEKPSIGFRHILDGRHATVAIAAEAQDVMARHVSVASSSSDDDDDDSSSNSSSSLVPLFL